MGINTIKQKQEQYTDKLTTEVQLELLRQLYKQSYFEFFKDAVQVLEPTTDWSLNFHHKYLCDLLEAEARRITNHLPKTTDYNINIPPRSSKSLICSVVFNAWTWACLNPNINFMYISHTESLALNLAQKTKDLIESPWFQNLFPQLIIKDTVSAKGYYQNSAGGIRMSFGAFGGITGEGADFIIVDDIIKPQDAQGILLQNSINTFKETIYNRLNNPKQGVRLIIGQRVAEGDLSGFIISSEDKSYTNICFPVELTDDVSPVEFINQYQNGLFWSTRFDWDVITDLRKATGVGEFGYATQYLQRPAPVEGGMIKSNWFELVDAAPTNIEWNLFIDTAQTSKKTNDPSAVLVMGTSGNIIYVKKAYELWLEFPELLKKVIDISKTDAGLNVKVFIEPKANGHAIIQSLRKETMLNVIELPAPRDGKIKRVQAITPVIQSQRVKLIRDYWNDNFLFQCSTFPNGKHDDQLDCLTYGINQLFNDKKKIHWYM